MLASNPVPQVRLTPQPANDFVDNRLSTIDPLFDRHAGTVAQGSGMPVLTAIDRQDKLAIVDGGQLDVALESQSRQFLSAAAAYEQSRNGKNSGAINLVESSSWADVIKQAEKSQRQYEGAVKSGFLGHLRGRFRSFKDCAAPVEAWLKLLPSQSWQGSLICGGMLIVLKAASRLGAIREDVCDALESIPESIDNVQKLGDLYADAGFLQWRASEMCIAILDLLEHIVKWYTESPIRKALKSVVQGDAYGKELGDRMKRMWRARQAVEQQANVAGHIELRQLSQVIRGSVSMFLVDQQRNTDFQRDQEKLRKQLAEAKAREQYRNAQVCNFMLRLLDYRASEVLHDLVSTVDDSLARGTECHQRAAWILQSPTTAWWLDSPRSGILLINSGEDSHERYSAVSFATSILVRALDAEKDTLILHWFCHQRRTDSVYSMLKSLVCQLLEKSGGLEIPNDFATSQRITIGRMAGFLTRCLEVQLRSTSVFIMLDSLSYYESGNRVDDLCWLLERIAETANAQPHSSGCTLKVMVTSPTRLSRAGFMLRNWKAILLDVPVDIDDGRADFDDRRLMLGVQTRPQQPPRRSED